jgi:hypothetical protein
MPRAPGLRSNTLVWRQVLGPAVADCDGEFIGVEGMAQDLASMPDGESSLEARGPDLQ